MSKIFFVILSVAVLGTFTGGNIYCAQNEVLMSELVLANVEALATGEGIESGNYDIFEEITDYYFNGTLTKQSKIITCKDGGRYKCSSGKYYRDKKEDGTWNAWTPA